MHESLINFNLVKNKVNDIVNKKQLKTDLKIIVVSKTFPLNKIIPLLDNGHMHYGENKVQEAEGKWSEARNHYKNLQLHMIGKLQSNKVKKAVKLFNYIHSLDNELIALKLFKYQKTVFLIPFSIENLGFHLYFLIIFELSINISILILGFFLSKKIP